MAGGARRSGGRFTPVTAGLIAAGVILVLVFFGFTRWNPFSHPYKLVATFNSANNLKPRSPVRIAGVDVGKVKKVEPIGGNSTATRVTMEIEKKGLPIHKDAELKIRPRIFLEGNFFVDVQPGTPSSPNLESDHEIPVNQTATPVQFGELLTALQSDTREDLKTFLREYSVKGLGNGGAEAYNRGLDNAPEALRNASIANEATLGEKPGDLKRLLRGQQRLASALTTNPQKLQDLVTELNVTVEALGRHDAALQQTVPLLRDTLQKGRPALASVNSALPSLRAFARDALPGVRSSGPTIDKSLPFVKQVRLLVRKEELRGLTADLRTTIPALARVNHESIPLLNENRALSACQNHTVIPFAKTPIPDPDFADVDSDATNQPFYKLAPRGLVGLSSEGRLSDANSPFFHVQFGSGPSSVVLTDRGDSFFAQAPAPPEGTRPARPNKRPDFRPGELCEKQDSPDMNASGGRADRTITPAPGCLIGPGNPLAGLINPAVPGCSNPATSAAAAKRQYDEGVKAIPALTDYVRRDRAGQPGANPWDTDPATFKKELTKLGLRQTDQGKIVKDEGAAK
jgi:phospholipid/cholesterol/gamma-HCH transport system substrate-binding protein